MADIDPKRTCRERQSARLLGICCMRDGWFYNADLYLISK